MGHFSKYKGTSGSDTFLGTPNNDLIFGGKGDDTLRGHNGSDIIFGGWGDDILGGGAGSDWVFGGKGNDTIVGGEGHDFLVGGKGNDTLVSANGFDILVGGSGADTFRVDNNGDGGLVWDFNASEGDKIDIPPGFDFADAQIVDNGSGWRGVTITFYDESGAAGPMITLAHVQQPSDVSAAWFV